MAANDPDDPGRRGTADRLRLAGDGGDPLQLRRGRMPRLDRGSGGAASASAADRWRGPAVLAVAALTLLAVVGLSRLRIDDDLRSLLRDAEVDFALVDEVAARFGTTDRDCLVLATATTGDLFSAEPLAALRGIAGRLAAVEGVVEVRSLLDVRREGAAGAVLPLIPHRTRDLSPEDLATVARRRTCAGARCASARSPIPT